ncbi:MAG: FtsX-like permease family protein [Planctomycetes bacterium]|nr:FtsX-like permease family protein [Planctomycetota bacterium]
MIALVRLAGLRHLLRHPLQSALCVLGIGLGVALVLAIDIAIASSEEAFLLSARAVQGEASHRIVGGVDGVPEDLYRELRVERGLRWTAPVVEGQALLVRGEDRQAFRLIGIDPHAELAFRPDLVTAGRGGNLGSSERGVVLEAATARALGLELGDPIELNAGGRRHRAELVAVIELDDPGRRKLAAQLMVVDIAFAQELLDRYGRLSRIDLRPPDDTARTLLAAVLPAGLRLEKTPSEGAELDEMLGAFRLNLSFLGLLALVVATFLIYGTISFSVVERREVLGRLRAFGLGGGRLFRLLLVESLAFGLPGTLLGVGLGLLMSRLLVDLLSGTISDHYFVVSVRDTTVPVLVVVKAAALGIVATLVSATWPARAAARTPARALLSRSELEGRIRGGAELRRAVAAVAFVLAAALAFWPSRAVAPAYGVIIALITGFAMLTPDVLLLVARVGVRPARALFGLPGLLVLRGLEGGMSRNAVATAALAMALAMTLGVGLMVSSFRTAVAGWLEGTLGHDIYLSLPGMVAAQIGDGLLDQDEVERVVATPGVARVVTNRQLDLETEDGRLRLVVLGGELPERSSCRLIEGDEDRSWRAFRAGGGVLVSEPLAYRRGLRAGDELHLGLGGRDRRLPILGVFQDYASERGYVLAPAELLRPDYVATGQSALAVDVEPGVEPAGVLAALAAIPGPNRPWLLRSQRAIREGSLEIFDRTFRITGVLELLAGLVAGIGIFSALMALQLERAWEQAVLAARGLAPRGLAGLVLGQSALLGLVAAVIAIPLGLLFAEVLVHLVNRRSFGWSLPLVPDLGALIEIVALGLGSALLAGLYPALRSARQRPAEILGRGGRR